MEFKALSFLLATKDFKGIYILYKKFIVEAKLKYFNSISV
jgi:hypothetical protein